MNDEYKLQAAQIAKELTIEFGGKLKFTNTSTSEAINKNLSKIVTDFYSDIYDTIIKKVEQK